MASSNENVSMALFCDFENVALGVRDANYEKFDIKPVLERLLLKGSIVVKKAYCDWDRYKGFKSPMHEANFELIEIPHVRQSGKNSADIRMVVDALDLCYTKSHVNTFVIISGDSDFSPLVSKLRENNKKVIGVGVKQSTSDLLVANCDEFIFYDDLVRESRRAKRDTREGQPAVKRSPEEERNRRDEMDKRRSQAVDMAVETFDALTSERGDTGKIWASVLKEAIKRRKPDFSESYYGFRTFGNLLEEAKARGLLEFGRDEKSGAYVYRGSATPAVSDAAPAEASAAGAEHDQEQRPDGRHDSRRNRGRGRNRGGAYQPVEAINGETASELELAQYEYAYPETAAGQVAGDANLAEQDAEQVAAAEPGEAEELLGGEAVEARAQEPAPAPTVASESAKKKAPKIPARQAKVAKVKAAQAAAAGASVWPGQGGEAPAEPAVAPAAEQVQPPAASGDSLAEPAETPAKPAAKGRARTPAKGRAKPAPRAEAAAVAAPLAAPVVVPVAAPVTDTTPAGVAAADSAPAAAPTPAAVDGDHAGGDAAAPAKPARKPAARGPRRPRKPDTKQGA